VARAILLGSLRPAGRVEIAMSATISEKRRWGGAREAFDRMLAELHPDSKRAGQQSHCLYKIIDAVGGYLYPQSRHTFPSALRESSKPTKFAILSNSPLTFSIVGLPGHLKTTYRDEEEKCAV
jgi:hypothetical protein